MKRTGSRLGPYEIVAPIGKGGMGEVYRARDTRLGRDVALKVLPEAAHGNPERFQRFEREARAVGALNHPNVVVVHDVGSQDGSPYLVSELLEGETLRERLLRGPLPPERAVEVAVQVARGLGAAHEKGIVHRDLKPENVFLTADGQVKVLDFGLAKLLSPDPSADGMGWRADLETQSDVVVGTAGYMAPEQVKGEPVDGRADVFALGACLHEMLTGRRAFHAGSTAETMAAILREEPADPSSFRRRVNPQLDRIVRRCLEKQRAARFQSARDLAFALESLSASSLAAGPGLFSSLAPRGIGVLLRRSVVPLGTLVLGAAGGALLVARFRQGPPPAPTVLRAVTQSGSDSAPAASPDGDLVAFASRRGGSTRIWLKQVRAEGETALTAGPADAEPRFFPDGQSLLFTRIDEKTGPSLWRVPVVGGEERHLFTSAESGDVSPDGTEVAFLRLLRQDDRSSALVVAPLSSGKERELARFDTIVSHPRFSPDGRTVALAEEGSAQSGVAGSIVLVSRDGSVRRIPLPASARQPTSAAWLGPGRSLLAGIYDASLPHTRNRRPPRHALPPAGRPRRVRRVVALRGARPRRPRRGTRRLRVGHDAGEPARDPVRRRRPGPSPDARDGHGPPARLLPRREVDPLHLRPLGAARPLDDLDRDGRPPPRHRRRRPGLGPRVQPRREADPLELRPDRPLRDLDLGPRRHRRAAPDPRRLRGREPRPHPGRRNAPLGLASPGARGDLEAADPPQVSLLRADLVEEGAVSLRAGSASTALFTAEAPGDAEVGWRAGYACGAATGESIYGAGAYGAGKAVSYMARAVAASPSGLVAVSGLDEEGAIHAFAAGYGAPLQAASPSGALVLPLDASWIRLWRDRIKDGSEYKSPDKLAISPDGRFIAAASTSSSWIALYGLGERGSWNPLAMVKASSSGMEGFGYVKGLCFSPDSTRLYAASNGNGTVYSFTVGPGVFSLAAAFKLWERAVAGESYDLQDLAVTASGAILVTSSARSRLSILADNDDQITAVLYQGAAGGIEPYQPSALAIAPDGDAFYALCGGNRVLRYDRGEGGYALTSTLALGPEAKDAKYLAAGAGWAGSRPMIAVAGGAAMAIYEPRPAPGCCIAHICAPDAGDTMGIASPSGLCFARGAFFLSSEAAKCVSVFGGEP